MSIFACSKCNAVENTATANYWFCKDEEPLCSECDPEIGKWHGMFTKEDATKCGYWLGADGFLYSPEDPPHHTKLLRAL